MVNNLQIPSPKSQTNAKFKFSNVSNIRISVIGYCLAIGILILSLSPVVALAAGVGLSAGGSHYVGSAFTISIVASGTTFNAFQGTISVSGPVTASVNPGGASWAPGGTPKIGGTFQGGITSPASSFTIATISLKGTSIGSGSVSVSNVELVNNGSIVATGGGSTSYTITRAPTPPGQVAVASSTHPDQAVAYEATTVKLSWEPPANGAAGYSAVFDQVETTVPDQKITTTDKTANYDNVTVGVHYFHIRAQNGDGWSPTTNFKIIIKASINGTLATPTISEVSLDSAHQNNVTDGTVTGLTIRGTGPAGYQMHLNFAPDMALNKDKYPNPVVGEQGQWDLRVTDPVKAGFYTLTAQGEKNDVLTPMSTPTTFEISVRDGGSLKIISAQDETSTYQKAQDAVKVAGEKTRKKQLYGGGAGALLLIGLIVFVLFRRKIF